MNQQPYSAVIWAISSVSAIAASFLVGLLMVNGWINYAVLPSHFIAPVLVGILISVINRKYLSKMAYVMLPIALALGQIVSFLGIIVIAQKWNVQPGDSLITDILVQYLPPAAGAHLVYIFYGWMAGVRVWWIGLLQLAMGVFTAFLFFNNAFQTRVDMLYIMSFGGSATILALLHFQAPYQQNSTEQAPASPKPETPKQNSSDTPLQ